MEPIHTRHENTRNLVNLQDIKTVGQRGKGAFPLCPQGSKLPIVLIYYGGLKEANTLQYDYQEFMIAVILDLSKALNTNNYTILF